MMHCKLVSFTRGGAELAKKIAALLPYELVECYARGVEPSLRHTALARFTQQAMMDCDGIVFIGATGIAVRAIAPYLRGKDIDPAVIVMDECGQFVIPLLSGHLGGANALAQRIAMLIGATPVLTTATDVRGVFAADSWARAHGFAVIETARIRDISAALLRGETIGLYSDFEIEGALPPHVQQGALAENGIVLSSRTTYTPFAHTLHLVPRAVAIGIGCRRGTGEDTIARALETVLREQGVPRAALYTIATIEQKKDEAGLLALCRRYDLPLQVFTADTLRHVRGEFTASAFVEETVGTDNVCERAAVCATGGMLLCRKTVREGVTIALAERTVEVVF